MAEYFIDNIYVEFGDNLSERLSMVGTRGGYAKTIYYIWSYKLMPIVVLCIKACNM